MALARVVTFDGVSKERMDEMNREMESGQPPEGMPRGGAHRPARPRRREVARRRHLRLGGGLQEGRRDLGQHAGRGPPGTRTSVTKYNVATRMKS